MQNLICCTLYYKDTGHNKYLIVSSRLVRCSPHSCSVERSHATVIRLVHVRDIHLQPLLPPLYLGTPLLHPQPLVQHPVLGFLTPSHHYHICCLKFTHFNTHFTAFSALTFNNVNKNRCKCKTILIQT